MDKVVHFEIPADDIERAKKFYKKVFDWKMEAVPDMEYTTIQTCQVDEKHMSTEPGAINGGMMKRQAPAKCPVITIAVEDIEETMKNVKKMGGSLAKGKMQVGDMGYAAYFKDTEGNVIGLWQNIS